jgi:glycosyltransferase involved in cell wall biosynthesis
MNSLLAEIPKPSIAQTGWPWTEETDAAVYDKNAVYPKITIITPTFNQGQFIEETIRSILLQNYPNLEYIIIDGGSTDGTVEIIKKYEPWITYWVSEKDRGQSHAINKGLEKCTGEICNWINSDDCLTPNALLRIEKAFLNKEVLCFCGNALVNFEDSKTSTVLFRTTLLDKDLNTHLASCSFSQPASFFRMRAFRSITPVEESLHMNMDMFMWYRFVCLYGLQNVVYTDEVLCTVKAHADAKTVKNFENSFIDKQIIADSLFVALKNNFKPQSQILPLVISPDVQKKMNYKLLRKNYCRTHFWQTDFNGKILKVNFGLTLEWLFYKVQFT